MVNLTLAKRSKPENTPDVKRLEFLSEDVLDEVVREAELMIAAQFQSHLASEQRGYAFSGILLATSSAVFGYTLANRPNEIASDARLLIALSLAIGLFSAGTLAIVSVWPRRFCIPGNEPSNWAPEHWPKGQRHKKAARLEQAKVLQSQISKNRRSSQFKALVQRAAIVTAYLAVAICTTAWIALVDLKQ